MKHWKHYTAMVCLFSIASCAVKNKLPKNTYLYKGATINIHKTPDNNKKTGSVKSTLQGLVTPAPNKTILGYPYKVAFWYAIGETKRQKGFKYWLKTKLGEKPVLSTQVNEPANAVNMQVYLENKGYFKSVVSGSRKIKGYKAEAVYDVNLPLPYTINEVKWVLDSSRLNKDIAKNNSKRNNVKKDDRFDLDNIKEERTRIDLYLKNRGYYYFSPDYLKSYVDTTIGNKKVNVYFAVKKTIPETARHPQNIESITLFPNYTLLNPAPDTSKTGLRMYDSIYIRDTVYKFHDRTLVRPITYKPNQLYTLREHNKTLNRYINMGEFKFVKSRYQLIDTVGDKEVQDMKVYYYLTPTKKRTVSAELAAFSKSNSFTGTQVNLNWRNRNLFKGAEQLNIKVYGAFELSLNDSLRNYNNWRLGTEATLTIPRFVVPFKVNESSYFPPFTKFSAGYEWMRRQLLFTQTFLRFQYDLNWKEQSNKQHTIAPLSVTYTKTSDYSQDYLTQIGQYPGLRYTLKPELIVAAFYNYLYTGKNPNLPNLFYLQANVEEGGSLLGLFNKPDSAYDKKIGGAYFAQYFKFDFDFRYSRKLAPFTYWANRLNIGVGMPYGNSLFLPFSKQYIIGGSNSLRGFPPRQLGPGRTVTTADQQVSYPQIGGDYKLEINSELRFKIAGKLRGALFADAGNIWMKNDALYGPQSVLTKDFMKDIAIDGGLGFRFDITLLIIRLDFGVPLRDPRMPYGSEWIIKDTKWSNVVINFGIGYPF